MPVQLLRGTLGEHVPLRIRTRKNTLLSTDGDLKRVNGVTCLSVLDPDGASVTPIPVFNPVTDGDYVGHWDATGLTVAGDYELQLVIRTGFDTVTGDSRTTRRDVTVRMGKQGGP